MCERSERAEELRIGTMHTLDVSGARNHLYAIPREESPSGVACVTLFCSVGPGEPEAAWHRRWLSLGHVPQAVTPAILIEAIRRESTAILRALRAYRGARWNGSNHVGMWSDDDDADDMLRNRLADFINEAMTLDDLSGD